MFREEPGNANAAKGLAPDDMPNKTSSVNDGKLVGTCNLYVIVEGRSASSSSGHYRSFREVISILESFRNSWVVYSYYRMPTIQYKTEISPSPLFQMPMPTRM